LQKGDLNTIELNPGKYAQLSVSDNGHGIPRELMDKIFEPYFTTKEQGKGTGLGLAVVYGIIKKHNGEITVESEVGKGTTFNILLPTMEKESIISLGDNIAELKGGDEHILLVDDEESVARLESQMLSRLGYKVTSHLSCYEALNAFKANPQIFDLILTDMAMPKMTGDQLAKEILSVRQDIPIIICTGFSEQINKELAERIGVKGFLMKPVLKSDMAQMVRRVLDEAKNI